MSSMFSFSPCFLEQKTVLKNCKQTGPCCKRSEGFDTSHNILNNSEIVDG